MRRGFTLTEVLVAVGLFLLLGGVLLRLAVRAGVAEGQAAFTTGAARVVEFFGERAAAGDGRFLPAPGQQRQFAGQDLAEALRSGGVNLARPERYTVRVSARAAGSLVAYDLEVSFQGPGGRETFRASLYGPPAAP